MKRRFWPALLLAMMTATGAIGRADAVRGESALDIQFEKYTLPNGMQVILHEDHNIPMVAVNIWYHVGSKNEKPGRTGFAHLFEHMMFQGSQNHDSEYFEPLEKVGAAVNGSTSEDRTNYWENVPPSHLEMALWLEADRMGYLLPAMTQEKLDNQRDVVKNERRQGVDNQPYGKAEELYLPLLYPANHPYSWTVIGSMEDLSAASMEDVSDFFRTYYAPNNASLCVAGDFDPAQAKEWIEKYFGTLPPGPPVDRIEGWIPELPGEERISAQDNVSLPRLYYVWHSPAFYDPGDAEADILATVLSSGKTSRLYKSLVYEQQIAHDVRAFQESRELSSLFRIQVTAKEGHTLEELERAVDAELKKILAEGITQAELEEAQNSFEATFVRGLQRVGGFGGRADALNRYNTMLGDPGRFQWDLDRYHKATTEDVLEFARRTIRLDKRVVLHITPQGDLQTATADFDRAAMPGAGMEPSFDPPAIQKAVLDNGLEVYVVEKHDLPLVETRLVLHSGWASDPGDRFGTASLTAELLDEGTKKRSALDIAEETKRLGAQLSTSSFFDGSMVYLNVLKKNLDAGLDIMADVALHPTFPEEELERQRAIYLGRIAQEDRQPTVAAFKVFQRELMGDDHPYSQPYTGSGTRESIQAISRKDLVNFYGANFHPNNAALLFVGDISMNEAKKLAEKTFRDWKRGEVSQPQIATPREIARTRICIVDKPGAAQSAIVVGQLGISRDNPHYMAFEVMNNVLGGQFSSRINMNLREDKGYTYGARSFFLANRGVGPFAVFAPVQTPNTKESIMEIVKEMRDIISSRPLTDDELVNSKNNLIKGFPQEFQTVHGMAGALGEIVMYNLPLDDWKTYVDRVQAVDGDAATGAASEYLNPDALLIVVVGDRSKIEEGIRELELGEVVNVAATTQVGS